WVLARAPADVRTVVVLVRPPDADDDWDRSSLGDVSLPHAERWLDTDGREARLFRAETSGQALLYDAAGRLTFHGGLTAARRQAWLAPPPPAPPAPAAGPVSGSPLSPPPPASPESCPECRTCPRHSRPPPPSAPGPSSASTSSGPTGRPTASSPGCCCSSGS